MNHLKKKKKEADYFWTNISKKFSDNKQEKYKK